MSQSMQADEPSPQRVFPELPGPHYARVPISFITVHYSSDLAHNLLESACVGDPVNQLVVVDNRENLEFATLSEAIEHGVARARHETVVVVHEDVLLLPGWQPAFESALQALDRSDPDWAFVGAAGWLPEGAMSGHWSDPHGYFQRMQGQAYQRVDRIDEHLIAFRRARRIRFDAAIPSIHNIGVDLVRSAALAGRSVYVVDAATVHKFADSEGRRIQSRSDSPKIMSRSTIAYQADKRCSDLYLRRKWVTAASAAEAAAVERRDDPVVLLGRGGSGTRLLSVLARDTGMWLGECVNESGDTLDLVREVYALLLARHRYVAADLRQILLEQLQQAAAKVASGSAGATWGFKLPESILILDELLAAFPAARFVHLLRDPLTTCLRRTHMTARFDNQIGQACLRAAYQALGHPRALIREHSPEMRMAVTTTHQLGLVLDWAASLAADRFLTLRFEDICERPRAELDALRDWPAISVTPTSGTVAPPTRGRIEQVIDPNRASNPGLHPGALVAAEVAHYLAPLRQRLGYLAAADSRRETGQESDVATVVA